MWISTGPVAWGGAGHREAGEPEPAGLEQLTPCHLRLAALSGDTYQTTTW
jgi:hypothetical protein